MTATIGSLFSGYGGLDLAVQQVYDAEPAWHVEFDAAPSRILAHHWPDVPNLHDVTTVDWATVEPVDILTGGFPCPDVSVAGRRAGMTDGTRSGLWSHMAHAIDVLRPSLVVIENVGGLFSAEATSVVEPHPWCLGDGGTGSDTVLLRAVDAVLSTLSELGYDAEWVALRASDVGAPHGRLRVFITAHPAEDTSGSGGGGWAALPLASGTGGTDAPTLGADPRPDAPGSAPELTLLPTPAAVRAGRQRSASEGAAIRPTLDSIHQLLPTPNAALATMGGGRDPEERRSGNHSITLKDAIEGGPGMPSPLLPTPTTQPMTGNGHARHLGAEVTTERFGPYAHAIARWERVIGRPAPAPTEPGKTRPRLSSRFVEWLMGLDDGHVTDVGITRNQQLKALGNGVVPQQGAAALHHLHDVRTTYLLEGALQ